MKRILSLFALSLCGLTAAEIIQIRVQDPHGLGIPGAEVEVRDPASGKVLLLARTGEGGSVALPVTLPVRLRAAAAGFASETVDVRGLVDGGTTIRLKPAIVQTSVEVVVSAPALSQTEMVSTALEIDRAGARTVFDAMDRVVPSLFVTRRGVMGYGIATNGTGGVSIRGVGGSPNTQVLIVVDGRPDYQGLMGHPLPDFYSLSNAETVTVTQGPASVLYGSNAMGGVVEVAPSRPLSGSHTRLSSSLGSYYTGQHRLSHGTRWKRSFFTLHAGIDHTRGERASSDYRSKDLALGAGYDFSNAWRFSLQGRYGHFHVEDPGPVTAPLANSYARVGRGGFNLNLDNSYGRTWGYLRFFRSQGRHFITDGFRSVDSTTGGRAMQTVALTSRLLLDAGSEIVSYGGRARNVRTNLNYGEHDVTSSAGFSRLQWSATQRLRLRAGYRFEHNSVFGHISVPEFGAAYQFSDAYSLAAAVSKGFRNPTIRELYLFPAPNPLLQPEHMWNYQLTFRAEPSAKLQASATAYYADLNNLIITTGRFPNIALKNFGAAINKGLEFTARYRPARRVQFNNGYAYLRSTNLAPFLPVHKWNSSVDIDAGRAFLHLGAVTVGKRWANAARTYKLGGYTSAVMKITAPVARRHSVFVMVDNLFDRRYEVIPNYPMPAINAAAGVNLEF
ncbi:MAG: TonB-dependent receptor [Bryobacteraceae bacterium]|nr:TonB-dependent receptor [Bryobacteraceae bacterium]